MYPNLYCSRVKTFFLRDRKKWLRIPLFVCESLFVSFERTPISSDQGNRSNDPNTVPAQIMIFTNLDLVLSRKSRVAEMRTMKSKIPNKKTETEEEETTRVKTSRVSSFVILCSFFTQWFLRICRPKILYVYSIYDISIYIEYDI